MSPGEVVNTGEINVYQGQLFHVSACELTVEFVLSATIEWLLQIIA